jgi:tripartite-type tricarboxylate transporter receptor subunit TctC
MIASGRIMGRVSLAVALIAWTGLVGVSAALAQKYPEREVRIINPYAPGGSADITGRLLAQKLAEIIGGQFIVENRAGAGGSIGAEAVAKASPDGHTLLYSAAGPLGVNHKLFSRAPAYEPATDFTPIAVVVKTPLVLAATPKLPAKNVKELIELARKEPGKVNFGSAGIGSAPHLTGEMFKSMAKIDIAHVPYKGTGPAMADLVGGHIQIMFDLLPASIQQIKTGTIKALASAGAKRATALPEVPTVSEQGLTGFDTSTWFALVAPANTPEPILARLRSAAAQALKSDDVVKRFAELGSEPGTADEKEARVFIKTEVDKWTEVVRISGAKVD